MTNSTFCSGCSGLGYSPIADESGDEAITAIQPVSLPPVIPDPTFGGREKTTKPAPSTHADVDNGGAFSAGGYTVKKSTALLGGVALLALAIAIQRKRYT